MSSSDKFYLDKICEHCGKKFTVIDADAYVFKIHKKNRTLFYCKWSHMEEGKKKYLKRKTPYRDAKQQIQIVKMLSDGMSCKEVANELGISVQKVSYWKRKEVRGVTECTSESNLKGNGISRQGA